MENKLSFFLFVMLFIVSFSLCGNETIHLEGKVVTFIEIAFSDYLNTIEKRVFGDEFYSFLQNDHFYKKESYDIVIHYHFKDDLLTLFMKKGLKVEKIIGIEFELSEQLYMDHIINRSVGGSGLRMLVLIDKKDKHIIKRVWLGD